MVNPLDFRNVQVLAADSLLARMRHNCTKLDDRDWLALVTLSDVGEQASTALAREIGEGARTTVRRLDKLHRMGFVKRKDKGRGWAWSIRSAGTDALRLRSDSKPERICRKVTDDVAVELSRQDERWGFPREGCSLGYGDAAALRYVALDELEHHAKRQQIQNPDYILTAMLEEAGEVYSELLRAAEGAGDPDALYGELAQFAAIVQQAMRHILAQKEGLVS